MKIRKATMKDVPALLKIIEKEKAIENYPGEYDEKAVRKLLKEKESITLVAETDGKVAGFCKISTEKDDFSLDIIGVAQEFRGRGIGRILFEEMEKYAFKNKIKRIFILVKDWNVAMNKMTESKGYTLTDKLYLWKKEIRK
ncbi:MAG: GNAT family N-acetyltransferase [Nanoarchaeota archaeon]|nr:GNAT family N-acetyltransferase [Nanoarchaeota archaeon]